MATSNNPLSSMSYVNKDFRAIYEELLDVVKKLTYKWDPSISNESDPGVILLKLDAIIGDKNNYNIDKNILEAFPETVTQEVSARSMYKQLAYNMPWYQSATTTVSFKWLGRELGIGEIVTIPKYTMLTDAESSVIYTLLEDVSFDMTTTISSGNVIQGIITDLTVNGSVDINLNNIDSNNRLYLNDYAVAENGIYITNIGQEQQGYWEPVDNLQVMPSGNTYYEFGVDTRNNSVYIEFPEDIETLIHSGLNVKYLLSDGLQGNVAAKIITNFYDDVTIQLGEESINLNEETVQMFNPSATTNGSDPEPVAHAYKSYRRVAGTFDTLVTLRDYINAIYNSELVSNCVVSDRLNDIQTTYSIVSDSAGAANSVIQVAENPDNDNKPYMTSYDLKMYLLHTPGVVDSIDTYEITFEMDASQSNVQKSVENYILDQRCIQHDFVDIESNIPCLFRNVYPLRIKLVPQYKLTNVQIDDIKRKIMAQLFETLNSREVDFGVEPDYNVIYDTIINADERIKLVVLDDLIYTTYATYWDGAVFKTIPISTFDNDPYIITQPTLDALNPYPATLNSPERYYYIATDTNTIYKYSAQSKALFEYSTLIDDFRKQILAKSILAGVTPLYNQETTFDYTIDQQFEYTSKDVQRVSTDLAIAPFGLNSSGTSKEELLNKTVDKSNNSATYTLKDNESIQFLAPSFITDINYSNYVKFELILQNSTGDPEYQGADFAKYNPQLNTYDGVENPTFYILNTDFQYEQVDIKSEYRQDQTYLQAWELGLVGIYIYTNVYRVNADTDYKLREGDYITFFYKEVDESEAPYVYRCYKGISKETDTQKSPIIRPSFTLNGTTKDKAKINPVNLLSSGNIPYNAAQQSQYQIISNMYGDNDLSGSKTIDIRQMNQTLLTAQQHYYYFITNNIKSEDDVNYYVMTFNKVSDTRYDYILKTDEYFIYTNRELTEFEVLGPGTLVRLLANPGEDASGNVVFEVVAVDYQDIAMYGLDSFVDSCKLLSVNGLVREQQIYNLTSGDSINIQLKQSYNEEYYPIFTTDTSTVVKDFDVQYSTNGETFEKLPGIDVEDNESSWSGSAILNIDAAYDEAQTINNEAPIEERQSIQQLTVNGISYPNDDEIKNASLLYLLSNATLTKVGGNNVDVTYLDAYGERKNLEILIYSLNPAFKEEPFFYIQGELSMRFDGQSHTVTGIQLQEGYSYMLGIVNNSAQSKGYTFSISDQNGPLHCLNNAGPNYPNGSYYFTLDSTSTQLTFTTSTNSPEDFLTIQHLVKYTPNELFEERYGITSSDIEQQILVYDTEGLFKYNYQVDPATRIDDPLEAKTFFEENHICNSYTIGNAQLRMADVNSLDSSISIINNR